MSINRIALILIAVGLAACDDKSRLEQSPEQVVYQQKLMECRAEFGKSNVVPIIGGGYIDMSRFGFTGSSVNFEEGQCGVDMLQLSFWWTGEEVLPDHPDFVKVKESERARKWNYYSVAAKLGNQRKARQCRENIDLPQCSGFKGAVRSGWKVTEWPEELTIKLKNYPGLEIWLKEPAPSAENRLRVSDFVMSDWRRSDGTPRAIDCWGLSPNDELTKKQKLDPMSLSLMTREELENIDFRGKLQFGATCEVDFESFNFKGGAGRVSTSTEALGDAPKALEAISNYLSESIIMENEQ